MKKLVLLAVFLVGSVFLCTPVLAVPLLQLDIGGGTYDGGTETIITEESEFTLYALLANNPTDHGAFDTELLTETFYISVALVPQVKDPISPPPPTDFGSFEFDGGQIDVISDMGGPDTPEKMPPHDIFPTYYKEFGFTFDETQKALEYNTADYPGGPDLSTTPDLGDKIVYWVAFEVDASNLQDYGLHFDLYNYEYNEKKEVNEVNNMAPFSHDAAMVPEPATMLLLGSGLIGLAAIGRKKFRRKS